MISVVIPARNEAARIRACLDAFTRQTFRGPFEIIVADNGSTDDTMAVVKAFGREHPEVSVRVVTERTPGIARACNAGFRAAKNQIIARTDADTVVSHDWLERIARHFQNPRVVGVGGRPLYAHALPASLMARVFLRVHAASGLPLFFGHNMAVRKDAFERAGGFDAHEVRTEDYKLSLRLRALYPHRGALTYDPVLLVRTSFRKYTQGWKTIRLVWTGVANHVRFLGSYLAHRV